MNTAMVKEAQAAIRKYADRSVAAELQRFFKSGPGEYGEGDQFLGVRVPSIRRVAEEYRDLSLADALTLLHSAFHEERLLSLIILLNKYRKGSLDQQASIYRAYLSNTRYINNWDLVDTSAEHIVGAHLRKRSRKPLYDLARSKSLWERRISIMSTFHFIKNDEFDETLKIAGILIDDSEDLIHKAVGWMLREIGKRNRDTEESFLKKHYQSMPRTMLRYAIEKFPDDIRQQYLKGAIK